MQAPRAPARPPRDGDDVRTTNRGRSAPLLQLLALLLTVLSPAGAWAQFDQYTAPGRSTDRPGDRKEVLEEAMEEARWHLGKVRLDPWLSLSEIEYFDNAFGGSEEGEDATADVTATVGAGVRAYLPAGPSAVLTAHVLPEYVWWKEVAARRRLNGRYGVGAFGFFNHLAVEATAARDQQRGFASPEFPQPVSTRADRAGLSAELAVTGRISLFAGAEDVALRNLLDEDEESDPRVPRFDQLDRDETILRGGLRYRLPRRWSVGFGAERTEVEFLPVPGGEDRSNSGTSPFFLLEHVSKATHLALEVSRRTLDPEPGSAFVPYEATAASFLAGFNTNQRLSYVLYGRRGIVYSLLPGYSYFQDDRLGGAVQAALGWRTRLRVYAEGGRDDYTRQGLDVPVRQDDIRAYGLTVGFEAWRRAMLVLRFARSEYDSDLPGADRSLATFGAGLTLGGSRASW